MATARPIENELLLPCITRIKKKSVRCNTKPLSKQKHMGWKKKKALPGPCRSIGCLISARILPCLGLSNQSLALKISDETPNTGQKNVLVITSYMDSFDIFFPSFC